MRVAMLIFAHDHIGALVFRLGMFRIAMTIGMRLSATLRCDKLPAKPAIHYPGMRGDGLTFLTSTEYQ